MFAFDPARSFFVFQFILTSRGYSCIRSPHQRPANSRRQDASLIRNCTHCKQGRIQTPRAHRRHASCSLNLIGTQPGDLSAPKGPAEMLTSAPMPSQRLLHCWPASAVTPCFSKAQAVKGRPRAVYVTLTAETLRTVVVSVFGAPVRFRFHPRPLPAGNAGPGRLWCSRSMQEQERTPMA